MGNIADEIFGTLATANACFAAGVKAADESNPAARKLRRLIAKIEDQMRNYDKADGSARFLCVHLRAAIEEARK